MGYVFDFKDAITYEKWFNGSRNRFAVELESRLIMEMLNPIPGRRLLDVGCGTAARWFPWLEKGLDLTGLDPSPYMLDMAGEKIRHRGEFYRGFGEDLPFEDNAFHYVTLITSLEYVDDPEKVLREAARVAKDKIFIGILNRHAAKCLQRRIKGMFVETVCNRARFFSIWEIRTLVRKILGDIPLLWKPVGKFPPPLEKIAGRIEASPLVKNVPFGSFAGIVVRPDPRYRTRPMALRYSAKQTVAAGGDARVGCANSPVERRHDGSTAVRAVTGKKSRMSSV
jgi:SAM-dependent methyltransferase